MRTVAGEVPVKANETTFLVCSVGNSFNHAHSCVSFFSRVTREWTHIRNDFISFYETSLLCSWCALFLLFSLFFSPFGCFLSSSYVHPVSCLCVCRCTLHCTIRRCSKTWRMRWPPARSWTRRSQTSLTTSTPRYSSTRLTTKVSALCTGAMLYAAGILLRLGY